MKRWIFVFCLVALAVSTTGAKAFTMAGTVTGGQANWLMLRYVIAIPLRLDTANWMSNLTVALPPSYRYTLSNLDSGAYIIFAFQDIHQTIPPVPQLDDPRGFYGDSSLPSIMNLQSDTANINIVLRPPNSGGFTGAISYNGTQRGVTYVMAFHDAAFDSLGGAGLILDTVQTGNGNYTALTDTFDIYYAYAFMDLNSNFAHDPEEPYGIYGGTTPAPISVLHAPFPDNVDIVLTDPSAVPDQPRTVPVDLALLDVYPNPFNNQTRVSFTLPVSSMVTLTVHDLLGRTVRTLAAGRYAAGASVVNFDGRDLTSGVYYLEIRTNSGMAVRKAMLLR